MNKLITILTPSYNRGKSLISLYKSLINLDNYNFNWLIIDDGSTDNTKELVEQWINGNNDFEIQYVYKENGGKHTALNIGFNIIDTELTFIVDSDDVLTADAIDTIIRDWNRYRSDSLSGIAYLRGYNKTDVIGKEFPETYKIYNDIDIRERYKITGDKAEVWRTDILSKYRFPVFSNEKFQGENYVWCQIALDYDMLYVNKIIYITEYLEGGLTKSGRKLRINCPLGGMENSKKSFNKKFPIKRRLKSSILYNCYAFFAKCCLKKRILNSENHFWLVILMYLPGFLLYKLWDKKYG